MMDEDMRWYDYLNNVTGAEAEKYLEVVLGGLSEAPELFRSMNPENDCSQCNAYHRTNIS